jgi:molybdopterin synthase sulfur carrier subunit
MKVTVKLFATLTQTVSASILNQYPQGIRSGSPFQVEVPEGCTLAELVALLDLPREIIKITFVNGKIQELDYHLEPGDEVGIFPPIAGG